MWQMRADFGILCAFEVSVYFVAAVSLCMSWPVVKPFSFSWLPLFDPSVMSVTSQLVIISSPVVSICTVLFLSFFFKILLANSVSLYLSLCHSAHSVISCWDSDNFLILIWKHHLNHRCLIRQKTDTESAHSDKQSFLNLSIEEDLSNVFLRFISPSAVSKDIYETRNDCERGSAHCFKNKDIHLVILIRLNHKNK